MNALNALLRGLAWCNDLVLRVCSAATIGLMAAIATVVCAGVLWRYGFDDALSWSEEAAKFLMVWLTFAAAPIALARGGHAAIDALPRALPPRGGQAVNAFIHLSVLLFMLVLIQQGWGFAWNARSQHAPSMNLSMLVVFISMPISGVLMLLVSAELTLKSIRGIVDPALGVVIDDEHVQASMSPE